MAQLAVPKGSRPDGARSGDRVVLKRFLARRGAVAALVVLLLIVLAATVGPVFWKYTYVEITPEILAKPSLDHPLGTDAAGHDMLAQVLRGTQRSLAVAAIVAVVSTAIGTLVGLVAGYLGGITDTILMRTVDLLLMMPLLAILGLAAVRMGGDKNGWLVVALAISLLFWTPTARVIRAQVMSLKKREFVESARLVGASTPRIFTVHLLPHLVGPIAVVTTTYVAAAIGLESTLSFLGLGVQPPDTSLGLLMGLGSGFAATAWWLFYLPGLAVIVIVVCVHVVGEGVQNAFDHSAAKAG
ncbi:ABC transporter permease [Streptomyces sp. NPDC051018]|uniref:ABC transporter permease n=1 Tax=Streptomyces sp. NPDC051018 TaxID=3365639 RepID=UPI00378F0594